MRFYQHKHFIHLFSLETYHKLVVTEIRVFHFQDLLFGNTTVLQLTTVGSEKGNRITAGWGGATCCHCVEIGYPTGNT